MTDFFKSNPMTLRHCLLYEYLQKIPIEESFNVFCKTVGDDIVKEEEFLHWFNQFEEGIFDINDGNKPIADMREVLRSDKYALHACILYESIKYKQFQRESSTYSLWPNSNLLVSKIKRNPSFFLYNNFCKVVGDDVMGYQEFDFWFYRFLNEEYDLKYEKEKDEEIHELTDMPIDVMKNIVEYLDIFDRMKLAKTSRSLQTFVEDQKLFHEFLGIEVVPFRATVSLDLSANIEYSRSRTGCVKHFKNRKTCVEDVFFWKEAILDFKNVLKNPKLHLDILEIGLDDYDEEGEYYPSIKHVSNELEDAFKFTHYLKVKKLILLGNSSDKLLKVLQTLKPGYLETIYIDSHDPNEDSMEKVFEMKQWKQAKYFKMNRTNFIWPLHNLYHFKKFTVRLEELSLEDIREMKKILFKSPDFEKCSLNLCDVIDMSIVAQEFGNALREEMYVYHYPIPNSTEYFEIKVKKYFFEQHFKVTRKKS